MKKLPRGLLILALAAIPTLNGSSSWAYNLWGCQWPKAPSVGPVDPVTTVKWTWSDKPTAVDSAYHANAETAASRWNAAPTRLALAEVSGTLYDMTIFEQNDGNVNYDGLTQATCLSGKFVKGKVYAHVNTYWANQYPVGNARIQIAVHEFGHTVGLAHNDTPSCAGIPIMYSSSDRFFVCKISSPQSDDINGVNRMYG
jgi:predicted Zn-dependent protease